MILKIIKKDGQVRLESVRIIGRSETTYCIEMYNPKCRKLHLFYERIKRILHSEQDAI